MKAAHEHARFGVDAPLYTPADRLGALHQVAEAARAFRAAPADPELEATWQTLSRALDQLDVIDRYLGLPVANASGGSA